MNTPEGFPSEVDVPTSDSPTKLSLDFTYAYGKPQAHASFKMQPSDFIVNENLSEEFSGEGEHYYLQIEKTGENTSFIANELARVLKIKSLAIGYSGLKDRHAVTTQWFSVQLPGKALALNWEEFKSTTGANAKLLRVEKHHKKLKRGTHLTNAFEITLRGLKKNNVLEKILADIAQKGVPNYFGDQRFGREGSNLSDADDWCRGKSRIKNKNQKGLVLSAARAYLFNLLLSQRVAKDSWRTLIDGDIALENAFPSGCLWGRGRSSATSAALIAEQEVLLPFSHWCEKLEHAGLSQDRRSLVLKPCQMRWHWLDDGLVLSFTLGPGEFATSVLREIAILNNRADEKFKALP